MDLQYTSETYNVVDTFRNEPYHEKANTRSCAANEVSKQSMHLSSQCVHIAL